MELLLQLLKSILSLLSNCNPLFKLFVFKFIQSYNDSSLFRFPQFQVVCIIKILICRQIILASQSPRRLEILKQIGLQFTVNVSRFPENLDKSKMTPVFTVYHEFHLGWICSSKCTWKSFRSLLSCKRRTREYSTCSSNWYCWFYK